MDSIYTDLFLNSFVASVVFSLRNEFILASIVSFGTYNATAVLCTALAGSAIAFGIDWSLGRLLMWKEELISPQLRPGYAKICHFVTRYLSWALLFSWLDAYGPFLIVIGGMFRVPAKIALPIAIAGKAAYYIYALKTGDVTVQF